MDTIFMETTVQADKFLGNKERKDYIEKICKGNKLVSSTYVLGEFKSNFLKDATTLYNLVEDSCDLGEALIRFEEVYSKRVSSRMCKLFGNLIREFNVKDKEEVLDRLEIYIEDILVKRFKKNIDKILIDQTSCKRSIAKPEKIENLWKIDVTCSKKLKPKCKIYKFLIEDNIENLKYLYNLPDELKNIKDVVNKITNNNDFPYGNNCRTLGDVIISLEASNECKILTTNKKDYIPICKCISKDVIL